MYEKIYDIDLGSQAPSIGKVDVKKVVLDDEKRLIQALDVNIHLTYRGDFDIGIDVFLAYGKTAFVSAKGLNEMTRHKNRVITYRKSILICCCCCV